MANQVGRFQMSEVTETAFILRVSGSSGLQYDLWVTLGAVVIAFVVCWLPYHGRRLMYCYVTDWTDTLYDFYHYFYMVTNVLFYVSSAVNPVLYNLVSANYRQIFFSTLSYFCLPCRRKKQTRMLTRHSISICSNQTFSTNIVKETVY
ncbi:hypothetical protein SRHO_G00152560 [Serrasalmus rhombeus]